MIVTVMIAGKPIALIDQTPRHLSGPQKKGG
jgi:hypothetical protein